MSGERVLVTGGSGFIGVHCVAQLLEAGYAVRTTVRDLKREADVRAMLWVAGAPRPETVSFVAADLNAEAGWEAAVAGCAYVLHVASPFPPRQPAHEDELIVPARDGALRVLRAARAAGVRRVVLTSSFAAVGYGHPRAAGPFDENMWTNLSAGVSPYVKSKTVAEHAAWDWVTREGGGLELAVINPVGVLGPVLGPDYSNSIRLVAELLKGSLPRLPDIAFGIVDVRDVADLHLRAMTHPAARGERFLATAGLMTVADVAAVLRAQLGAAARRVPTQVAPNWLIRLAGLFNADAAQLGPDLGQRRDATSAKARHLLDWAPRSKEAAVVATAESLARLDLAPA